MLEDLFEDGRKLDDSKTHLVLRPAYARIDKENGLVLIWDYGPNYRSFSEMSAQRKEVSSDRIRAGLLSAPGMQFANRGISLVEILRHKGQDFLLATHKRNTNMLGPINGYYGNGIDAPLEHLDSVPKEIHVFDDILRTTAIEDFEECNFVQDGKVLRGEIQVVGGSRPFSFAPFEAGSILPYTDEIKYRVIPFNQRPRFLTNLSPFSVAKVSSAEDKNLRHMGENVRIYFDPFHNCYQIVTSLQTTIDDIDFIFQTEDRYRDEKGMDTFLYRDGIKLIRLDEEGRMVPEIYTIKSGKLERLSAEGLMVSEAFVPGDKETGIVVAKSLPFYDAVEAQRH